MATAKFNDVDDFLSELRLDAAAGEVDRLILRLVYRWKRVDPAPMQSLSLVASYATGSEPVRLEHLVGTHFPGDSEAKSHQAAGAARREKIEAVATECGLTIRGGVYE